MHDYDDDRRAAEAALEKARRLPGGPERIEALRHAGRLRFAADRKHHKTEQDDHRLASKSISETERR